MQRPGSGRVGFSPDISKQPTVSLRSSSSARRKTNTRPQRNQKQAASRSMPSSSPVRLFHYVRINVVKAIRLMSKRRQPSTKASSNVVVPQQFVPHRDSHHYEALEDSFDTSLLCTHSVRCWINSLRFDVATSLVSLSL